MKSEKNRTVVSVHSQHQKAYAKFLEKNSNVLKYETLTILDDNILQLISKLYIRKDYFDVNWTSDFLIYYKDGTKGIREIANKSNINKKSILEKLELSRRYWEKMNINDWKIVIF